MERALVSVKTTDDHRELLQEANELVTGSDGELIILWFVDEESFEADKETLESVGKVENVNYRSGEILEGKTANAERFIEDSLGEVDTDIQIVVTVEENNRAERVISTGARYDCDHAFIVGQSRSPTGKALFGDFAQQVILSFDGYVTIRMA